MLPNNSGNPKDLAMHRLTVAKEDIIQLRLYWL